jgi:hypothetical protein
MSDFNFLNFNRSRNISYMLSCLNDELKFSINIRFEYDGLIISLGRTVFHLESSATERKLTCIYLFFD